MMVIHKDIAYQDVPRTGNRPGKLTQRQRWIWHWMRDFQAVHHVAPTLPELQQATGIRSRKAMAEQLDAIIFKGFARRGQKHIPRSIVAVVPGSLG